MHPTDLRSIGHADADDTTAPSAAPVTTDERQALRQALVDLEAAKARVDRDAARTLEETRAKLVAELLPVLDNLDRSIAAGGDPAVLEGVRLVRTQLVGVLRGYGLTRFDALGARFDPREHDAVTVVEVPDRARDGVVVEQWEPGYRVATRLLRPARVAVGRFHPTATGEPERAGFRDLETRWPPPTDPLRWRR